MTNVHIIIVDDEIGVLQACKRLFENEQISVFTTTDPKEALSVIDDSDIKIVLSDNRMPGISGVEFLRQVKEKQPDIIRILFTGQMDTQVAEDAINKGEVYRLVNKPWDPKELLTIVKDALEKFDLMKNNKLLVENIQIRNAELETLSAKLKNMYEVQQQFTSTVSHELRTPLAAIKSSVDILNTEAPGKLSDEQKVFIKRVKNGIDRLSNLINNVLDLSKLEAGKMVLNFTPVNLQDEILEIVEMHTAVAQNKGLRLEIVFAPNVPSVILADKDRLMQVFNNLINNALKHTQEGTITILASYLYENKANLTFCIRDTGVGISADDIPKLFKKFEQVGDISQRAGGTGLGLVICKKIIEEHGGKIWVESCPGEGTSFFFTIPLPINRILIVDDDPVTLNLLRNTLAKTEKYELDTASSGFITGQKCISFKPHLIILDINLPGINGFEICTRLKNDPGTKGIKIIMHSTFTTEEDEKRATDAGADGILKKPADPTEIISCADIILKKTL
jgi:two-component system sensor histidine kinase/response regulator